VYLVIISCNRCGHRGISPASTVDDDDDDDPVAISVHSEHVSSTSRQRIYERRRTKLTAKTVEMVMFQNGNADRF